MDQRRKQKGSRGYFELVKMKTQIIEVYEIKLNKYIEKIYSTEE